MKKIIALLLVALCAFAIYYYQNQIEAPKPDQAALPTPVALKVARLRIPTFALMLNPLKMSEVESRRVATLLHSGLIAVDQKGKVLPRLATRWEQLSNGSWQFDLRGDVSFSNGIKVDASSVVASLCASLQPSSPWAWSLRSIRHTAAADGKSTQCDGLRALSATQLVIEQSEATPWLVNALASPAGWVLPSGVSEQAYGVLPGIGPYEVEKITADTSVILKRRAGGVLAAGFDRIEFSYVPDSALAAAQFAQGNLDALEIDTPTMLQQLFEQGAPVWKFKGDVRGRVEAAPAERVRVVIVNEKKLMALGFSPPQVQAFKAQYDNAVDRKKLQLVSLGLAEPMFGATLLPGAATRGANTISLPVTALTLNMEPDAYSDLLAANLPTQVGNISIKYAGIDKGVLIGNLIKGEYDLMLMVIESPVASTVFWSSLFTEDDPFSAFGKPIAAASAYQLLTSEGVLSAARKIDQDGNWIGVIRESRVIAYSPNIGGVYLSPSGQPNIEAMAPQ